MAVTRWRGYLPHLESSQPTYFVTFRLADSLPLAVVAQLREERQLLWKTSRAVTESASAQVRLESLRTLLRKTERWLDRGVGACYMRDPQIAGIVADAMLHFRGTRYRLRAWCVMPNHVHAVFSPVGGYSLATIVQSWKSFSALAANQRLGRKGRFWQREYFDHLVRDEASLQRIVRYVRENPEKAGLRNWTWVGGDDLEGVLAGGRG